MLWCVCSKNRSFSPFYKDLFKQLYCLFHWKGSFEILYFLVKSPPIHLAVFVKRKVLNLSKEIARFFLDIFEPLLLACNQPHVKFVDDFRLRLQLFISAHDECLNLCLKLYWVELRTLNDKEEAVNASCLSAGCSHVVAGLLFVPELVVELIVEHLLKQLQANCCLK